MRRVLVSIEDATDLYNTMTLEFDQENMNDDEFTATVVNYILSNIQIEVI